MAAFPIYAEQQANAFLLVKELGSGVETKIDHRKHYWCKEDDIVKAEVIENGIRQLMMNQENEIMRKSKVILLFVTNKTQKKETYTLLNYFNQNY